MGVSRPVKFEHFRYVGDKRNQRVYDLDLYDANPVVKVAVDELMEAETFIGIAPQTLAEARNRGYKPHKSIRASDDE
jgi:hypothetical protein